MRISDWSSDVCSSDLLRIADDDDDEVARLQVLRRRRVQAFGRQRAIDRGQRLVIIVGPAEADDLLDPVRDLSPRLDPVRKAANIAFPDPVDLPPLTG